MGKNQYPDPGSGMNNLDSLMWIRDGKKSDPGSEINIPGPQHCPICKNIYLKKEKCSQTLETG
jgi:hypothetical protein